MRVLLDSRERKPFPNFPDEIPDEFFNEEWAQKIHGQTLARLNERGGLDPREMIMNIEKLSLDEFRNLSLGRAINSLNILMQKDIKISAGLVIIQDNKILLEHPTNHAWENSYSIPKGEIEEGEDLLECAIRETEEELGIQLDKQKLLTRGPFTMEFKKYDKIFKKVHYFVCHYPDVIEIDQSKLQLNEIDWAGFLTREEGEVKISWRQKEVLNYLT